MGLFNKYLCAKILWRALNNDGLWGSIIICKYLRRLSVVPQLRFGNARSVNGSVIWCSLLGTFPIIIVNLSWQVGRGSLICIGLDPIIGITQYQLSQALLA